MVTRKKAALLPDAFQHPLGFGHRDKAAGRAGLEARFLERGQRLIVFRGSRAGGQRDEIATRVARPELAKGVVSAIPRPSGTMLPMVGSGTCHPTGRPPNIAVQVIFALLQSSHHRRCSRLRWLR